MPELAVATVVAKNYVSFARVLAESFLRQHPDIPFFALLSDEVDGHFDPAAEPFRLVRQDELGIPDLPRLRARYDRRQIAVASKPYLLSHLLDRGFGSAIFLDPDIWVLGRLDHLFSRVREHAVVLMPHLLAPLSGEDGVERELNILRSGVYNGGFVGVSARPSARAFLRWWQERVHEHCRHDVAHWNLPERAVRVVDDAVTVDGRPCRFFHFSGFDPDRPHAVTRYSPRLDMSNVGPAAEVFRRYLALLAKAGYQETKGWSYAYGSPGASPFRWLHRSRGDH